MKTTQHPNLKKVNKKPKIYIPDLKEEAIHLSIAKYLDFVIKRPSRWHTIEVSNQASGFAAMRRQQKLKAKGVRTGFPDIHIIWIDPSSDCCTPYYWRNIFLEIKSATGKLTAQQEVFHKELDEDSHYIYVVRSREEVEIILKDLGVI